MLNRVGLSDLFHPARWAAPDPPRPRASPRRSAPIDHLSHLAPLERLGTPGDIAAAVSFLAGPDGSWINGQALRANGDIV
jgi:NAD(P)-dependent dehydrogenase (short-subunit alcohol dehydrogenase family)